MKKGFTLVEISIVLVVGGLLIGGVLAGQELLNQAHLNSQIKQIRQFESARTAFLQKYEKNPGDLDNASSFFSDSSLQNGNGDNKISEFSPAPMAADIPTGITYSENHEPLYFWNHLSAAKMLPNPYVGSSKGLKISIEVGDNRQMKTFPGENIPLGTLDNSCVDIVYKDSDGLPLGHGLEFEDYFNYYEVANAYTLTSGNITCADVAFSSEEALRIDTKIDDGLPASGVVSGEDSRIEILYDNIVPCVTGGAYDTSTSEDSCVLLFGFLK